MITFCRICRISGSCEDANLSRRFLISDPPGRIPSVVVGVAGGFQLSPFSLHIGPFVLFPFRVFYIVLNCPMPPISTLLSGRRARSAPSDSQP